VHIDKAKKRIAKQVKKGFNGYPLISLEYFGATPDAATELVISFVMEESAEPQVQTLACKLDAREDETIQSTVVKIIERTNISTLIELNGVSIIT
jgi:hypothetical protein